MIQTKLTAYKKFGPLFISKHFEDAKDPCIVFDGKKWHLYGSGGSIKNERWQILHATAPTLLGPWTERVPAILRGVSGPHVAAPSVIFDATEKIFHMAVQRDFTAIGGTIDHLTSQDGKVFVREKTLLNPIMDSAEAGLYDPHFGEIKNKKYVVYAGMPNLMTYDRPFTPQPDIFIAESKSDSWTGPWERCQKILDHDEIAWHHNSRAFPDYEWGIEGPQIVELPDGRVLLNATCFIEEGARGTRQRVFFAISDSPLGPFHSLGPVLGERDFEWESGENGHASVWVEDDTVYLFYQGRPLSRSEDLGDGVTHWKYGLALFKISDIKI